MPRKKHSAEEIVAKLRQADVLLAQEQMGADVREEAARAHNERTANYLLGMPMLGDLLEEGLSMLGYSCEEFEIERL
jgi:hypothetical protein